MRSVRAGALLLAATTLLAACGSRPVAVEPAAVAPMAKAVVAAAPSAEARKPVTASTSTRIEAEQPVGAATQRAFDDALALQRAGRFDDAERVLKAIAAVQPQLGGVHANLGLIHRRAGRSEQAVADFEAAVKANPLQARYFNQLGIALREAGQFDKARDAYEQALALDPLYANAHMNLAILNDLYVGNTAVALTHYMRCIELTPADAPQLNKWVAELKTRKAALPAVAVQSARKEKE
jgi:tetratricopeptide (TPR) repeat protein